MNYKDYGLNRYDEVAVRSIVLYLETLDDEQRQATLVKMESDKKFFSKIVSKSIELYKKDYEVHSRVSLYYKFIGQEYLELLKTVDSDGYLNDVPPAVYQYIRDCIK